MGRLLKKQNNIPVEVKASLAYTVCSIVQKSLSFITIPLFTRLLTTEQYGQSSIYHSWVSILTIFITLNLPYGSFNRAMIKYKNDRDTYVSSIGGISVLLAAVFCVVYFPFYRQWNQMFELPTLLVGIMIIEIVFHTAILLWTGKQRFNYKYKSVVFVTLAMAVLSPIVALLFVKNSAEKGYARIVGGALVIIGFGLFFYVYNLYKGKHFFNKEYWKYALSFNIPLIPYYLSQTVFNQSDRIMISHITGKADAGIYSVGYSLAITLTFVLNSINNAYVPWMYRKIDQKDAEKNKQISIIIAALMAVLLLGVVFAAPEIIYILAGERYEGAVAVVPPVAISLLFLFYTQLFVNIEFYYEQKKWMVGGTIVAAISNIALNAVFIPKFGFVAAAYTTLVSYIIFFVLNWVGYNKIKRNNAVVASIFAMKKLLVLMGIFIIAVAIAVVLYPYRYARYAVLLVMIGSLIAGRKRIIMLLKDMRKTNKSD